MAKLKGLKLDLHPAQLSESEQAVLADEIAEFGLRANQMRRDTSGRLYAAPVGTVLWFLDGDTVSKHEKIADSVTPSPDGTRFTAFRSKWFVKEFTHGTHEATAVVCDQLPRNSHIWGVGYLGEGNQLSVLFSDGDNNIWLLLFQRTDQGWVEIDNLKLRTGNSLAAAGAHIIVGSEKKLAIFGARDGRLHTLGTIPCLKKGVPMTLAHEGEWILCLGFINTSKVNQLVGLEALWDAAKPVKAKRDTLLLQNLCRDVETTPYDEALTAARTSAYEAFAAKDGTVIDFVGPTRTGFVAEWPKDVFRHVSIDGDGGFEKGPKLVPPGKRFTPSILSSTGQLGDRDVLHMAEGHFLLP